MIDWWEPETGEEFKRRAQCVIDQYSKFSPIPGVYVNGKLTQGENIADMGGIKNAFHAISALLGKSTSRSGLLTGFLPRLSCVRASNHSTGELAKPSIVDGLTRGQLFFVSFAQGWCTKATEEYYRIRVASDPHSPPQFRVLVDPPSHHAEPKFSSGQYVPITFLVPHYLSLYTYPCLRDRS